MSSYTQDERLIAISVTGLADNTLLLQSFTGVESVSHPFSYQLELLSEDSKLDFTKIIGQKAVIRILTPTPDTPRYINGYVSRFAQSDGGDRFQHYHMEIVPWLWFLTRHADCRIFHNASIPEIIQKVFDEFTAKTKGPVKPVIQAGNYSKLEYCVQYRETSFNFISRLMEHAGIYYYFEHTKDDHTLVLADDSTSSSECPLQASASYMVKNTGEDSVSALYARREFRTGQYTSVDYNFKTPAANLVATENTVISVGGNDPLEIFDYPGLHGTAQEGRTLSKTRMEEHEAAHQIFSGSGRVRSFISGYKFTLKDHFRPDFNASYFLTEIRHAATAGQSYFTTEGPTGESYSNQFTCMPVAVPFRPARLTPKPFVQGPQTAIVIGKADYTDTSGDDGGGDGEEIWVDNFGRVVVRFPWDRAGKCSCRVRVSHAWAGQGWGFVAIPRVGQEVIVSFLEGDPDRPIITGRVYNADQMPPYTLPDNQTKTGIKSRSSKGGTDKNFNEICLEDKKGQEDVLIHAERTMHNSVEASQFITVGGDRHITTGGTDKDGNKTGDVKELIFKNSNLHVKTDQRIKIDGESHLHVVGKADATYDADIVVNATGKSVIIAETIQLQAKTKIVLMAGSSSIVIDASGVTVLGSPLINLNTPGAPPPPAIAPPPVDPDAP